LRSRELDVYKQAFFSFIAPILEYGTMAWSPSNVEDVNIVECVLRSYSKRAFWKCHVYDHAYEQRLNLWDIESLEARRVKLDLKFFYKALHNIVYVEDFHSLYRTPRVNTRGHNSKLYPVSKPQGNVFLNSFMYRTCRIWNALPAFVADSASYMTFCSRLRDINVYNYVTTKIRA